MNNTNNNSIFLQKTGISSFSLRNEVSTQQSSGGQTGNSDDVGRILSNAGFSISNPVDFRRFLLNNTDIVTNMFFLPMLIKNNFDNSDFSSIDIEVMSDSDDEDETPEVYVVLETNLSVEDANRKLSLANKDILSWGDKASKINLILNYS